MLFRSVGWLGTSAGCGVSQTAIDVRTDAQANPPDAESFDAAPMIDAAPDAKVCANGRVLFLNFNGVTITAAATSDARQNQANWIGANVTVPDYRAGHAQLVEDGLVEQRRGAGSFVLPPRPKMRHSLSTLVSFTEYMQQRGKTSNSRILLRGLFPPQPDEQIALGLASTDRVARIERLRSADGIPMAIEHSSLPADILPDPERVEHSLYEVLRASGSAPVRAVQRMSAMNVMAREAGLLNLAVGAAVLRVDRTGFLSSGRPIEFTCGIYRSDIYDFIAELHLGVPA